MSARGEEETKKRKANSPVTGRGKERREEDINNMSEQQVLETDFPSGPANEERRSSIVSRDSYLSSAIKPSNRVEKPVRKAVFTTQKPDGAFRDEIVVEIQSLDEKPFKGTITPKEARLKIFEEILGFQQTELLGFYFSYSGCPIVTFKLKSQFNIDQLEPIQSFVLERKFKDQNEERTSTLQCKIRGIRSKQQNSDYNYQDEGFRWVKIEGCEYRLEEKQILDWLSFYGEIKSELSEDTHEESEDSSDDFPPVGNGIYSVKMKLTKEMPQLIPMFGKRIRLYYRGIVKRCTNCFGTHQRKNCQNEKVAWITYVEQFTKIYPEVPFEFYGRWANLIKKQKPRVEEDLTIGAEDHCLANTTNGSEILDKKQTEIAIENENETETEMENPTKEEEIHELVQSLVASGISAKTIKNSIKTKKKETKPPRQRSLSTGKGRGRPPKLQKDT